MPRRQKRLLQVVTDVVLVWIALWLTFIVRLNIDDMYNPLKVHFWLFSYAPLVAFHSSSALECTMLSCAGRQPLIADSRGRSLLVHEAVVPRSIMFSYWWLSLVIIGGYNCACANISWAIGLLLLNVRHLPIVMTV